jgi:8-oxo-dGTP pyrophosphatase MutT (NUDIX family)
MADSYPAGPERRGPWTRISSRLVYENPWIAVREDQVLRPDGSPGIYGVVHFRNLAVGVVALDAEGRVILVGQYRYTLGLRTWEIPEGGCPEGEEPPAAAARELEEETGYRAARWDFLGTAALSNSATDEIAHLYLARELTPGRARPEATEDLACKAVPWEEAWSLAMEGEAADALTVIALARARHRLEREAGGGEP